MKRHDIEPNELFKHPGSTRVATVEGDMTLIFTAGQTPTVENYTCVASRATGTGSFVPRAR